MPTRSATSLRRVLQSLGTTVLELVHGRLTGDTEIGGVAIYDPCDGLSLPPHAIVLGVGVGEPEQVCELLDQLGKQETAALVVRRAPVDDDIRAAVDRSGVALLQLTQGAAWAQVAALLRVLLAEDDVGHAGKEGDASGDLFALANALAALIDAPVTIEDRSSRVLAFSGRQDEADGARIATILGRQVPEANTRALAERGVFDELYHSQGPIFVDPLPLTPGEISLPRAAIAVRAGDEILGSIWATVRVPPDAGRANAFREGANMAALQLLRMRAGTDVGRRLRAELVSTALEGGPSALEALARLRLSGQPLIVIGCALSRGPDETPDQSAEAHRAAQSQQLADAFAVHLGASQPRSAAALVGDVVYGILPVVDRYADPSASAVRIATAFIDRISSRLPAVAAIGPLATEPTGLTRSRLGADRALRVLQSTRSDRRVARLGDVQAQALLLELGDLVAARADEPTGPLARLIAYDDARHGHLVETLRAWLDAFGDITAASARLFIHHNTFRYRLRRVVEVGGIDLDDPETRFEAMLQLRLMPSTEGEARSGGDGTERTATGEPTMRSSVLRQFAADLADDEPDARARLLDAVQAAAGPLMEPADGQPGHVLVTFVAISPDARPYVRCDAFPGVDAQVPMQQVPGSDDLWWAETVTRADVETTYQLQRRAVDVPDDVVLHNADVMSGYASELSRASYADPLNPRRIHPVEDVPWQAAATDSSPVPAESILLLPEAAAYPWAAEPPREGRLHRDVFESGLLGNTRPLTVWTPPGYDAGQDPLPLVILFDGETFLQQINVPRIFDNLLAGGRIRPFVAALVHNATAGSRMTELPCNPVFADAVADELVAQLRARFRITEDAADVCVGGFSYGGLAAAWLGHARPDAIGAVLAMSPSCWWGKRPPGGDDASRGRDGRPEWLTRQFADTPCTPVRYATTIGILENDPLSFADGVDTLSTVRRFHDVLDARGYHNVFVEIAGGHDVLNWRRALPLGLAELLPADG